MKLYTWPTSPFGCKVKCVASACNLLHEMDIILCHPWEDNNNLRLKNPLNKIPVLWDNGFYIYDSPVICDYLVEKSANFNLIPQAQKWNILRQQALSDGILDAAVLARYETNFKPAQIRSHDWYMRQIQAILSSLDALNQETLPHLLTLGGISIAMALSYLKLRYPDLTWNYDFPHLDQWHKSYMRYPCISCNLPDDATPLPENLVLLQK